MSDRQAALPQKAADLYLRYPMRKPLLTPSLCSRNRRLPSTVHAVLVSAICLHQLLSGAFGEAACAAAGVPPVLRATGGSWGAVGLSLGYFVADAFMVASQEALYSTVILVHHVSGFGRFLRCMHAHVCTWGCACAHAALGSAVCSAHGSSGRAAFLPERQPLSKTHATHTHR